VSRRPTDGRSSDRRPRWDIDDVLARTDLAQLLDEYTTPAIRNLRGRRWHCPDPHHDDHRPSVTMRTDHRGHERWRCWSGDHRGDAIDLVMVARGVDRRDAIETLAGRAGLTPDHPLPPPVPRRPTPRPSVVPLDPLVVQYAQACERILHTLGGDPVRRWLADRGIGPDVARANHVGADPGRQRLFRRRGLPYGASVAATFPALDQAGNIRYVQARYLDPVDGADKYDNPSRHLGSNPRISWTRPVGDPRPGLLVVTEGIPDGLTAAQAGYTTAAILGSQNPDTTVAARLATRAERDGLHIVAVTDADPAGHRWGGQLGELLAEHDHTPTLIQPPVGNDLNDWAQLDAEWTREFDMLTPFSGPAELPPVDAALGEASAIDGP
jgi:DNA primase